jgi:hypothetical protein
MKQVILTEAQFNNLIGSHILNESILDIKSVEGFKKIMKKNVKRMLLAGMSAAAIYAAVDNYCNTNNLSDEAKQVALSVVDGLPKKGDAMQNDWVLADTTTTATVYNAIPAQCNGDFGHTASMFRLNLDDVLSQRVIAMERTFMAKLGLKYGDVVRIEGTDGYDGVWQIQDTMNKRFAGQHKIDILVPNNIKYGMWDNVKLYTLKDKSLTNSYRSKMAPQTSKEENKRQVLAKKQEFKKNKNKKA